MVAHQHIAVPSHIWLLIRATTCTSSCCLQKTDVEVKYLFILSSFCLRQSVNLNMASIALLFVVCLASLNTECALHSVQCALHSVPPTVCPAQCALQQRDVTEPCMHTAHKPSSTERERR